MVMGEIGKQSDDFAFVGLGACQFPQVIVHLAEGFTGYRSRIFGFVLEFDNGHHRGRVDVGNVLNGDHDVRCLSFEEVTVMRIEHLRARVSWSVGQSVAQSRVSSPAHTSQLPRHSQQIRGVK